MPEIGIGFENANYQECAALHKLLGLPDSLIESPYFAPKALRLDKLWTKTPGDLLVPSDREIFLGFDFDQSSNEIICSENTLGKEDTFEPKQLDHLVWLHTEPAHTRDDLKIQIGPIALHTPTEAELFGQNFPMPYLGDMDTMMKRPSIYASVIIRLPYNNERAAALVALKTKQFKK